MTDVGDDARSTSLAPAAVEVRGVRVYFGDVPVLRDIDLAVAPGTNVALVGPNGAGKSTLLRVLAGLVTPSRGEVRIAGHGFAADPTRCRRSIGMVGHQPMVHPELTARENLRFYARLYALDRGDDRVEAALRRVDLRDRADSRAATLSRGMVQRLALARALLHEPSVLLLDEAETGLDSRAYAVLAGVLRDPAAGRSAVMASHDLHRVRELADRVVFLHRGRIVGTMETAGASVGALQERYADALAHRPAPARQPILAGGRSS